MQEFINILRQQLILCKRVLELGKAQQTDFTSMPAGENTGTITHETENVLAQLAAVDKQQDAFFKRVGRADAVGFLSGQPASVERNMAQQLLQKLTGIMQQIKKQNAVNRRLLDRHMQYINFNVNVMTQVSSEPTYAPTQGARQQASARMKMFDTSI